MIFPSYFCFGIEEFQTIWQFFYFYKHNPPSPQNEKNVFVDYEIDSILLVLYNTLTGDRTFGRISLICILPILQ